MATKRVSDAFSKEMRKFGYSPVDVLDVGTDPFTHGDHYIVVGKSDAGGNYATWSGVDWAYHPKAADRKRGVTLNSGRYGFRTKTEAMEDARSRVYDSRRDTRWDAIASDNRKARRAVAGKRKTSSSRKPTEKIDDKLWSIAEEFAGIQFDEDPYGSADLIGDVYEPGPEFFHQMLPYLARIYYDDLSESGGVSRAIAYIRNDIIPDCDDSETISRYRSVLRRLESLQKQKPGPSQNHSGSKPRQSANRSKCKSKGARR